MKRTIIFYLVSFYSLLSCATNDINKDLGTASVQFSDNHLIVSTGKFERTWDITTFGMVTTGIKNLETGKQWCDAGTKKCDWGYYGLIDEESTGKLLSIKAEKSNDEGFTSDHIQVIAEFEYPDVETFVKYEIRVYPDAPGIFTQVAFKGNSSQYVTRDVKPKGIEFKVVSGKNKYDYFAHAYAEDYIVLYVRHDNKVEFLIPGLDPQKEYKVGISWWDFGSAGRKQKVSVSSVDGEKMVEVIPATMLPDNKDKKDLPVEHVFDLPEGILLDGSFRLIVDKLEGLNAVLSEIWIMEKSNKEHTVSGNIDRITDLHEEQEEGWSLAGYFNCGQRGKGGAVDATGYVDFIPVKANTLTRRYIGYYNDTQHRNKKETPLIKEEVLDLPVENIEKNGWASVLYLESEKDALIVVKESHKCVNQYGHDTGGFEVSEDGVANTGTSLVPKEILPDRYRKAWASWTVTGENTPDERELALKSFERKRFHVNPETDIYIIANTWGSGRSREASIEHNILTELEVQKYLGIDVQQIDDGWQSPIKGKPAGDIPKKKGWYPHPHKFPEGFKNVRAKADELGLKPGLWFPAIPVKLQEMKDNYDDGGFSHYKLDFANIGNHNQIEKLIGKIRAYELYTNHTSKVNWDVTENAPRFGFFWAKEYGCVYLENRKPYKPVNVVYIPYLVLRDLWHLSKYCNLNKFQGTVQNIDKVNPEVSDAHLYNHPYVTAIPLMSTPLFFQETHFYSQEARDQVKSVLTPYREVRNEIYESFVYPIGEEPDNESWAGFQAHHPEKNVGYITLFRELNNEESKKEIQLRFLKNKDMQFTNLMTGEKFSLTCDEDGKAMFEIAKSADFRFLKYEY